VGGKKKKRRGKEEKKTRVHDKEGKKRKTRVLGSCDLGRVQQRSYGR